MFKDFFFFGGSESEEEDDEEEEEEDEEDLDEGEGGDGISSLRFFPLPFGTWVFLLLESCLFSCDPSSFSIGLLGFGSPAISSSLPRDLDLAL